VRKLERRAVDQPQPTLLTDAPVGVLRAIRLVAFDFDGVFTDDAVYVSERGEESVRCWRGDGLGLRKLDALGIATVILSTEVNAVVTLRARKLRIECLQGLEDKRDALTTVASRAGVPLSDVAYVGNDINDALCFSAVGVAIAASNAHQDVRGCVRYRTGTPGGYGAVREVCDCIERAHRMALGAKRKR
jgi:3-deoxy-D-manno-octulosonate 8-phosphate phosphatase (KDO 8-P phosphatase)